MGMAKLEYEEFRLKCKRIGVIFPEEEARRLLKEGNVEELRRLRVETRRI